MPAIAHLLHARASQFVAMAALALIAALATGCSKYTLKGKVIESDITFVALVNPDDPRLDGPGVGGVALELITDPERLNRKLVGQGMSGPDGEFAIPFSEIGGGVLLYDVGLRGRKPGYESVEHSFRLPPPSKRVLILLRPGQPSEFSEQEDLYQQYERYR